jgi:DNA-binding response OmpR family regulator
MKLLLVEDDELLGKALHAGLRAEHATDWLASAEDASAAFETTAYDLVVLDINLPGINGLKLLESMRHRGDRTPVLLLTARDTVSQRVEGLDAGADDYLVKPFDFDELLARIRALSRRGEAYTGERITHGDIVADARARTLIRAGKPVALSFTQFAILLILLQNPGRYFSKSQIEDKIYGWDDLVESNTIEVHVSALRRKLGRDLIKTSRGIGYVIEKPG